MKVKNILALQLIALSGILAFPSCERKAKDPLIDLSIGQPKDITLAGEMEMPNGSPHIVIKVKGDKARIDLDEGISTIQSGSTPGTYVLNHSTKTIEKVNLPEIPNPSKDDAAMLVKAFAMTFTGRTDTIAGWKTREFLLFDMKGTPVPLAEQERMVAWVADDFPDGRELQQILERVMPNPVIVSLEKAIGKKFSVPGFALRSEVTKGGKPMFKITYTAIKQGELPEKDFEIPKDYMKSLTK